MDKGLITGAVFLDLSKAFNFVNYTCPFDKLQSTGFSSDTVKWFQSYLTNRKQVTAIANYHIYSCTSERMYKSNPIFEAKNTTFLEKV